MQKDQHKPNEWMDGIAYYENCLETLGHIVKIQDCVNKN